MTGLELWGGVECTVNRVGERYRDQMRLSGHHDRRGDLALVAALGIRTLRFPVLWERVAPDRPGSNDWRWTDERLGECQRLGIRPILGLLHHGSGPRHTSLVDPAMPALFERYAASVADRYPWAEDWTPVNEPVTTARFSALYGAWYPHARDTRTFWLALLGQIDATRLAMRAVRRVNPAARLIQTDDLGQTWSTPPLGYVADYYNARRWLGWDLLAGRVDESHPLWDEAAGFGLGDRLRAIRDDPCPPDVVGVNHYPTSDRFLDDRAVHLGPLPDSGFHDVEALRIVDGAQGGFTPLLRQAWDRYRLPLVVTECHLGCTREEQLRWLNQAWRACEMVRGEGVDVRAVTIWALFGSVDWNSLLTVEAGHYEPGAFDIRSDGAPRPTALARAAAALTGADVGDHPHHAMARMAGWWERPIRFAHPRFTIGSKTPAVAREDASMRPILITGGGELAQAFVGACSLRGLTHLVADEATLPIGDEQRAAELLDLYRPWAVVNAAGWSDVDAAGVDDPGARTAAEGAGVVARACAAREIACLVFSSDAVFDGRQSASYAEADAPNPLRAYGRCLVIAEDQALAARALVVRSGPCFSPYDEHNLAIEIERTLGVGRRFVASEARVFTPTYLPDLVRVCLDLLIDGERGLWHLTSGEAATELDFARRVATALGLNASLVVAEERLASGPRTPRPASSALGSTRGALLPGFDDALARHATVRRSAAAFAPVPVTSGVLA